MSALGKHFDVAAAPNSCGKPAPGEAMEEFWKLEETRGLELLLRGEMPSGDCGGTPRRGRIPQGTEGGDTRNSKAKYFGGQDCAEGAPVPRCPQACRGPGLTQCWGLREGLGRLACEPGVSFIFFNSTQSRKSEQSTQQEALD